MAVNAIKYATVAPDSASLVGSVAFGWPGGSYGPSEISGWYSGVTPPSGGYVIYATSASQIISATVASNDTDLITIGKQVTGQNFTSSAQVQTWMNANGYAVATTVYSASGDLIRSSLTTAYTSSYDSASVGAFIQVDYTSYNNVFNNLSATKYGMTDAVMTGSDGGGSSWGSTFSFAFTQSAAQIPSSNYMVGYSVVASWASTQQVIAYFTTASAPYTSSASVYYKLGGSTNAASPALNTRLYFVCKAPTLAFPGTAIPAIWSNGSFRIKGPNIPSIPYFNGTPTAAAQFSGSWNNWNTANTGQPAHQFMATSNKQW